MNDVKTFETIIDRLRRLVEELDEMTQLEGPHRAMRLDALCHLQRALDVVDQPNGTQA